MAAMFTRTNEYSRACVRACVYAHRPIHHGVRAHEALTDSTRYLVRGSRQRNWKGHTTREGEDLGSRVHNIEPIKKSASCFSC